METRLSHLLGTAPAQGINALVLRNLEHLQAAVESLTAVGVTVLSVDCSRCTSRPVIHVEEHDALELLRTWPYTSTTRCATFRECRLIFTVRNHARYQP